MTTRRAVAVLAHPDDEVFCAGLLTRCKADGIALTLLTLTRGEAGFLRARSGDVDRGVAQLREQELQRASALLGVELVLLDGRDGRLVDDRPRMENQVATILKRLAPEILITFGADGAYGHRDHQECHQLVRTIAPTLGSVPETFYAAFPRGLFASLHRKLARFAFIDDALSPDLLGHPPTAVDRALDLATEEIQLKREVIAAHQSQLRGGDVQSFLEPSITAWLLRHEWYRRQP